MEPQDIMDTIRHARQRSLYRIKHDAQEAATDRRLLQRLLTPASYEGTVYWIARLQAHFPARQTENDAVVKGDLAGDCVDEGLSICALVWVCDELRNEATKDDPFMPPSGEILQRTRKRTLKWRELLTAYENPPQAEIPQSVPQEINPKANDGPEGPARVRVMVEGLRYKKGPDQALTDAGYEPFGEGS